MHVEECCQALLSYALPAIDHKRKGVCIDVGVGTFALYCELFSRLGFETVAVEPLPLPELIQTCRSRGIILIESCLYDKNGSLPMFTGSFKGEENLNLSSIRSDWWGSSSNKVQVRSMTLAALLKTVSPRRITCLKLDVEGVESVIIRQLQQLETPLLPAVVMFEYGGGSTRQNGQAGWSETGLEETLSCFRMLKDLHYRTTVLIDSSPDGKESIIDLDEARLHPDDLFQPRSVYGNVICFREHLRDTAWIERTCGPYRNNDVQPPAPFPAGSRWAHVSLRLRRALRRLGI